VATNKKIALAGKQFFYNDGSNCIEPRGRVCAFSNAFSTRHLEESNRYIGTLILNAIAWVNMQKGNNIAYFDTENEKFNTDLETLLTTGTALLGTSGHTITKLPPWYEPENTPTVNTTAYNNFSVYLLFPNYNAKNGTHMPDALQQFLIDRIKVSSAGLVTSEWFHFLQSIKNDDKRSFSFHGDGTKLDQLRDETQGLFTVSPFAFSDFLTITQQTKMFQKEQLKEDDISYAMPAITVTYNTTGQGEYTTSYIGTSVSIFDLNPDIPVPSSQVGYGENNYLFYTSERTEDEEEVVVTTTVAPVLRPDIKFKVAEVSEDSSCGPMKRILTGQHANLFEMEGDDIYLIKRPLSKDIYKIKVKYSDLMSPKRFDDFYKAMSIPVQECGTPLSVPLGDYSMGWKFETGCRDGSIHSASSLSEDAYTFSGEGTPEVPFVVELGGRSCEQNLVWVQVNQAGSLSFELSASSDCQDDDPSVYCEPNGQTNRNDCDFGTLHLVSGINIHPRQHQSSAGGLTNPTFNNNDYIVRNIYNEGVAGKSVVRTGSEPFVMDFDPESNVKVFILVGYSKDKNISLFDDKITAKLLIGTTEPPDPVVEEFTVLFINRIPNTFLVGSHPDSPNRKTLTFKMRAGNDISDGSSDALSSHINDLDISFSINSKYEMLSDPLYTIIPSDSPVTVTINSSDKTKAFLNTFVMPIGGGSATVYIDGETSLKPTTTPAPKFTYSLVFKNFAATTRFAYRNSIIDPGEKVTVNFTGEVGTGSTKTESSCSADYLTYQVINSDGSLDPTRHYRDDETNGSYFPYVSVTDSVFSEPASNANVSCSTADIITQTFNSNPFKYCKDNDKTFDIIDGISVSYGRACNSATDPFPIRISIPDIPDGGGTSYIRIDGIPVATTPPPTTEPPATTEAPPIPCDDLILVQCVQALNCSPDGDLCVENLSNSINVLRYETCCPDLTEDTIITRVYSQKLGDTGGQTVSSMKLELEAFYAQSQYQCSSVPTIAFSECLDQESNGNCVNVISTKTLDAVTCGDSSMNPLP